MKNLVNVSIALVLVGMFCILMNVMKEVAESGPVIHKAVSTIVGDN